ncbi:hypothetical protein [Prosthecomicrobium sp. N25]|uniref:hypothetical protein n=1 Tax=Prosthecomicrobium sp. N25 TaxID=3129254 RepID=UPI00307732AF
MDRSTKLILIAIAAGLWANAAGQYIRPALAQGDNLNLMIDPVVIMERTISSIARGLCSNPKIC